METQVFSQSSSSDSMWINTHLAADSTTPGMDVNLYVCGDVSEGVPRGNVDNTAVAIYITSKVLTMSTTSGNTHSDMHTGGGHTHH